jgi:serine/threonine protein phosphatase PrpC
MSLKVSAAQHSDKGPKAVNDDALALHLPEGFGRSAQVMIAAIADGVSTAESGGPAAMIATRNFCSDFLGTDLNWSVQTAGYKVIDAINRWLYSQGQHYNHSYSTHLTTFSSVVVSGQSAHIFHVGDSRVWRYRAGLGQHGIECLTKDHTIQTGGNDQLIRALGMDWRVDVAYLRVDVQVGDYFLLTTDGIHGSLAPELLSKAIQLTIPTTQITDAPISLEQCVQRMTAAAQTLGSRDNQSCQLVRIDALELSQDMPHELAGFPPLLPDGLQPGQQIDGFKIVAEIHANTRSKIYHAIRQSDQRHVTLKAPGWHFDDDVDALQAFVQEDWIGQRISHPDIVTTYAPEQSRQFLYLVQEYLPGQTLRQWRAAHPDAPVQTVIKFVKPAVRALRALHRRETLHQDVKPDNFIVCESEGQHLDSAKLKLIDFGSAHVGSMTSKRVRPGAMEYAAPEYALDQPADARADQFALAVTFYELLTGHLPYGEHYVTAKSSKDFAKLIYTPAAHYNPHVPAWMDAAIMRACSLDASLRYEDLGEWQGDLEHPNHQLTRPKMALMEQHPVQFWQTVSAFLLLGNILWLLARFHS